MILQRNIIILSETQAESWFGPTWREFQHERELLFDGHFVTAAATDRGMELVAVDPSTNFERIYA